MPDQISATKSCPSKQTLVEFLLGKLQPQQVDECERHLNECEPCGETVRGLDANDTMSDLADRIGKVSTEGDSDQVVVKMLIDKLEQIQPTLGAKQSVAATLPVEMRIQEVRSHLEQTPGTETMGRLAHYDVQKVLGVGATSVVFLAHDQQLHRDVALKVLRPSLGDEARERFINEARAAAAVDHENVIKIYQVANEGPLAFMAQQWLPGETLETRLNRSPDLTTDEITQISIGVASGLAVAHQKRLIHRDIKPANIWIESEKGRSIILDFGLVRVSDSEQQMTETGMIAGTPNYMSPEQTRGREVDERSDLFSLGCVMYRLISGRLPFQSPNTLATLQAIQNEHPPEPRSLNLQTPAQLSDLVTMLMSKDANHRPQSASQIAKALEEPKVMKNLLSTRKQFAKTSPKPTPTDRKTSRWLWGVLAASLFAFAAIYAGPQIVRVVTNKGVLEIETNDPSIVVEVIEGGEVVYVIDEQTNQKIEIAAGSYLIRPKGPENTFNISNEKITMKRGENVIVTVTRKPRSQLTADDTKTNASEESVPEHLRQRWLDLKLPEVVKIQAKASQSHIKVGGRSKVTFEVRNDLSEGLEYVNVFLKFPRSIRPINPDKYGGKWVSEELRVTIGDLSVDTSSVIEMDVFGVDPGNEAVEIRVEIPGFRESRSSCPILVSGAPKLAGTEQKTSDQEYAQPPAGPPSLETQLLQRARQAINTRIAFLKSSLTQARAKLGNGHSEVVAAEKNLAAEEERLARYIDEKDLVGLQTERPDIMTPFSPLNSTPEPTYEEKKLDYWIHLLDTDRSPKKQAAASNAMFALKGNGRDREIADGILRNMRLNGTNAPSRNGSSNASILRAFVNLEPARLFEAVIEEIPTTNFKCGSFLKNFPAEFRNASARTEKENLEIANKYKKQLLDKLLVVLVRERTKGTMPTENLSSDLDWCLHMIAEVLLQFGDDHLSQADRKMFVANFQEYLPKLKSFNQLVGISEYLSSATPETEGLGKIVLERALKHLKTHGNGQAATAWRTIAPILKRIKLENIDTDFIAQLLRLYETSRPVLLDNIEEHISFIDFVGSLGQKAKSFTQSIEANNRSGKSGLRIRKDVNRAIIRITTPPEFHADLIRIQGNWYIKSLTVGGKPRPKDGMPNAYIFNGTSISEQRLSNVSLIGSITPKAKPGQLALTLAQNSQLFGPERESTQVAMSYRFNNNNQLEITWTIEDKTTPENQHVVEQILARAK